MYIHPLAVVETDSVGEGIRSGNSQSLTAGSLHRYIVSLLSRDPAIQQTWFTGELPALPHAAVDLTALLDIHDPLEFVRQAYATVLSRNAHSSELREHLDELSTLSRSYVLDSIVRKGLAANPNLTVEGRWQRRGIAELLTVQGPDLVNGAFRSILWRDPTFEEYVRYLWAIERLGSAKTFLAELASVPEARRYPPLDGLVELSDLLAIEPRDAFVARAYGTILGREPDAAGFDAAMSALRWLPRKRYLTALATSHEAQTRPAVFFWRGRPIRQSSLRQRARLHLSSLVDSLFAGVYRRLVSIEAQVASSKNAQAELRHEVSLLRSESAGLKAAVDSTQVAFERHRERHAGAPQAPIHAPRLPGRRVTARRVNGLSRAARALIEQNAANTPRVDEIVQAVSTHVPPPSVVVGDRLVVSRVQGFVMAMPAEDVLLTSMLTMYGSVDAGLAALFSRVVRRGMIFVDVGAHIGIHTIRAASLAGDAGCVYSFEPAPRLFDILTTNVILNGFSSRVVAERKAVTESAGNASLILKQQTGHNTLFGRREAGDGLVTVETVSLDEALGALPRIDIVKIDAEGAEPAILRGMTRLLARHPAMQIVIEFAPALLRAAEVDPLEFASLLEELGFSIRRIDDMTGELAPASGTELLCIESSNLFLSRA